MFDFIDPLRVLDQIEMKKDAIAVDFGSGSGGWALPLAKKLPDGKVFAVDVQEAPLSALASKAQLYGIPNVERIIADVEKPIPGIGEKSCDFVLMTNILFQVEDIKAVLQEAKRILKPDGSVLVVDWKEDSVFGPQEGKVPKELVEKVSQELGFRSLGEVQAGNYHYGLLFSLAV
jgi:ubiquinone/menaquinone biosynthesis C-methylase UbiE